MRISDWSSDVCSSDLLRQLRLRGIKNLGQVVVDRSMFGAVATDPGAVDDSPYRPYNASPDAMMVNLGAVRLLFQPDAAAKKWIPIIDPPLLGLHVGGALKWSNARCPGSPEVAVKIGSASGRGSVSQYVWISVGDG